MTKKPLSIIIEQDDEKRNALIDKLDEADVSHLAKALAKSASDSLGANIPEI